MLLFVACHAGRAFGGSMTVPSATILERFPLWRERPLLANGSAIGICVLAMFVRLLASIWIPVGYPYVSFSPAVILSAFLFGTGPGIVASILCWIFAWYCFIPPVFAVKMSPEVGLALAFYMLIVTVDIMPIRWLQRANHRLAVERERSRQLADRSELLFRELQHRVSNNLQVVSGILTLQMRGVSDSQARNALDEASRRLGLIGRIQRQLYDPKGEQLALRAFLEHLAADIVDAGGKPGIGLTVEADEIALEPDAAVSVALIIAEAVANAVEHGFAARDSGEILIRAKYMPNGQIELLVIDDGAGLPVDFDLGSANSLGLQLARMLARQLGGEFSLAGDGRTVARLTMARGSLQ